MATINKKSYSKIRTTIATAFYANNVEEIKNLKEAYRIAKESMGTIVTDQVIFNAEQIGLDKDSKVLIFNDGAVTGRYKDARVVIGESNQECEKFGSILREEMYKFRNVKKYCTSSYIGLDEEFMIKAHLMVPQGSENTLYNWLLNFQYMDEAYKKIYDNSLKYEEEDILIYSNPEWYNCDYPLGLAIFDPENNCAAILGMKYFGEHKKGTLTLAWNIGRKQGFIPCHGGIKEFNLDKKNHVMSFFGLSGSGKSTLTHCDHNGKYNNKILHDDAFLISTDTGVAIALEPSYFDKTQDYPGECEDNKFLLSLQNCGANRNENGKIIPVTEDIRNSNGRAIKSKLWKENRVDKLNNGIDSIVWISKDPALPPVLRINDPILASTFGATLATKRSTAEKLKDGVDPNEIVIEPYANPFRVYPLIHDYKKFKELFLKEKTKCYIINTGSFIDKDITKEVTLNAIEKIIEESCEYKKFGDFLGIEYLEIKGYEPNFEDAEYVKLFKKNIGKRIEYLKKLEKEGNGVDILPDEALNSLDKIIS